MGAEQPPTGGNVGMIGFNYFTMTQLAPTTQHPPQLKAIVPVATPDLHEGCLVTVSWNSPPRKSSASLLQNVRPC